MIPGADGEIHRGLVRGPLSAAWAGTLDEAVDADFLLHVVDASHPDYEEQMVAVREVLDDLEILEKPCLLVLNKIDRLAGDARRGRLKEDHPDGVTVSALHGDGLEDLKAEIASFVKQVGIDKPKRNV